VKVLVSDRVGQEGLDFLAAKGYEVVLLPDITPVDLVEKIKDIDALIVRGRTKVTKTVIEAGSKLKVIARSGTGVDNIDLQAAKEAVAEHAFAFMLALARNLVPTVATLKSGKWTKPDFRGMELKGKTLGVLGHGHIGKRVAELGGAFGMEVVVYKKDESLEGFLATCDIVSIHVPLTEKTRGMIGSVQLQSMKKTAFLINTARGPIVDEEAPNVIVTPHVAADSREGENRASMLIAQDIDAVLSGGKPTRQVLV
jgi:D-3-phosphoglycerate dehydrogenase